jgi:hypothetical protein
MHRAQSFNVDFLRNFVFMQAPTKALTRLTSRKRCFSTPVASCSFTDYRHLSKSCYRLLSLSLLRISGVSTENDLQWSARARRPPCSSPRVVEFVRKGQGDATVALNVSFGRDLNPSTEFFLQAIFLQVAKSMFLKANEKSSDAFHHQKALQFVRRAPRRA